MRISRPSDEQLVLTRTRRSAVVRLLIWLAIVATFYWVLLAGDQGPKPIEQLGHSAWLLLLVPLLLLPYLLDIARVLARGESHVFDASAAELRTAQHPPVPFAQIQCLELSAMNGTCEELSLSVRLRDGRSIPLLTDQASPRIVKVATEAANLAGVELTRR